MGKYVYLSPGCFGRLSGHGSPRCRVQSPPAYLAGPCFKNEVGTIRCHLNLHDLCVLNSLSEADPRAPKRSKKPSAFNPTVPSQTGPKGPEGALRIQPNGPLPNGPRGPWARRALLLSSKRRSDITTGRKDDGATIRRSEFIGSAGCAERTKINPCVPAFLNQSLFSRGTLF